MLARLALVVFLFAASSSSAGPRRQFVISWTAEANPSTARRQLIEQVDHQLRLELARRGISKEGSLSDTVVLRPSVEVVERGLSLSIIGLRQNHTLVGSISTRATGSNQPALIRALVARVCDEAEQL